MTLQNGCGAGLFVLGGFAAHKAIYHHQQKQNPINVVHSQENLKNHTRKTWAWGITSFASIVGSAYCFLKK